MKSLIIANWKCNPLTLTEAQSLFGSVREGIKNIKNIEVVICPPFVYLPGLKLEASGIKLGGQDCFWEKKGPFTGEISPQMLKNLGCDYVIVGHSERRKYFQERNEMIKKKLKATLSLKLKTILCVGETKKERKEGKTAQVLKKQLKVLDRLVKKQELTSRVMIAYEPVWAIGTGKACGFLEARKSNLLIRHMGGEKIPVLYGGSVDSQNAKAFIEKSEFDGLLVGGASLKAREFIKLVKNVSLI
jgi:triosephosphate isomerase